MTLLEKAIALALRAHSGQVDRYGQPYILHPLFVMQQMDSDEERIAAVLHDVVEDSEITLDDLRAEGFPAESIEAVRLMTHDKQQTSYEVYVAALKPNPIARKVKVADLQHNMDIRRMDRVRPEDVDRLQRYHQAWETLNERN